jgi:uncharacterized protein (TIGR02246 family)
VTEPEGISDMTSDEQAIRDVVSAWMAATRAGQLDRVLELMDDDVVFLAPGRPPMRGKAGFAEASRAADGKSRVDGDATIKEVQVHGDWAYVWNQLTVTVTPLDGGAAIALAGPAMSIFRKTSDGRWLLFRDANMLTPS